MAYKRYDSSSVVLMANGHYLFGISAYTDGGDLDPSDIIFYTSNDLENWSYLSTITPPDDTIGVLIPSLYVKADGSILIVFLNLVTSSTSRILSMISSDNGGTWEDQTILRENASEYIAAMSGRLFLTDSGRLLMPFEVNTNGILNSQSGNYTGYTLYSDNEGTTWLTGVNTITSPDDLCVEGGFFKRSASTITRYFRNRSNVIYATNSTDNGINWGAIYDLGVQAINSTSTVLKSSNNGYFVCFNPLTKRTCMQVGKSSDATAWGNYLTIAIDPVKNFIEPTLIEKNGTLYTFYSKSDNTLNEWTFCLKKIPMNY